jgi:polyhydroxybutyrate depolymerase
VARIRQADSLPASSRPRARSETTSANGRRICFKDMFKDMSTQLSFRMMAVVCASFFTATLFVVAVHAQDPEETLTVDSVTRSYAVHLPKGYDKQQRYPVVLLLHGFNQDGDDIARISHFNQIADANGVIAVYPNAIDHQWDLGTQVAQNNNPYGHHGGRGMGGGGMGGGGMGGPPWGGGGGGGGGQHGGYGRRQQRTSSANDLAFFDAMLDKLEGEYSIDPARIYATGLSAGGFMDFRLGCLMSERIAAIAPVGAAFPESLAKACGPAHAMPVLLIAGTSDPVVNYKGNERPKPPVIASISVEDSAKTWSKLNSCGGTDHSTLPPKTSGGMETKIISYTDCQQGAAVALYAVQGGGNTWPGGEQYMLEKLVGKTSADFDADEVIWKFFAAHKLQMSSTSAQ